MKPTVTDVDHMTEFWAAYQEVENHEREVFNQFAKDLDTYLLSVSTPTSPVCLVSPQPRSSRCQAGLFSAVTTAFIVQTVPLLQPNPLDLTNALLLQILQQNGSFDGSNLLTPVVNVSPSVAKAQSLFFTSLAATLFVAFFAAMEKNWAIGYRQAVEKNSYRRHRLYVGFAKSWTLQLHGIMPGLLQLALFFFSLGVIIYLWDFDPSAAGVILGTTCLSFVYYLPTALGTPDPIHVRLRGFSYYLLLEVWLRAREIIAPIFDRRTAPDQAVEIAYDPMKLSNPAFWRQDPLFTSPLPTDPIASAGLRLLENSTDFFTASAIAAASSEFQWPVYYDSTTPLLLLRDTYTECFQALVFDRPARIKALESAAAYYVLYHTRLIWDTSKGREPFQTEQQPTPDLPPDLLLYEHSEQWDGCDLFEYLLCIEDRLETVESARFLSYIATYWFCGDTDSAVRFRSSRLPVLPNLIAVLESSRALALTTLTDCALCVGAAMDFPLHPEDLIRVNKRCVLLLNMLRVVLIGDSDYLALTFKTVVEHINDIALAGGPRYRHVAEALEILLTLDGHTTLPLFNAAWANKLLKRAAERDLSNEHFTLLLKLSARRAEEDVMVDTGAGDFVLIRGLGTNPQSLVPAAASEAPPPDDILFGKVMKTIQTCDWQDEAAYGGLLAIRDIGQLEHPPFDDDTLQTFHDAMNDGNPLRVRQAVYNIMLATQDHWLKSEELRQKLEDLDFFRQLHRVVEISRPDPDYQRSFLQITETLSEDVYWRSYLREAMDTWLPLHNQGPEYTLHIIANVGELSPLPRWDGHSSPSFDEFLQKLVVDEWAAVPGRRVGDLTAGRLKPLAEVTEGFKELLFDDNYREATISAVQGVIPGLEQRREDGDEGPGEDVRGIVRDLLAKLRSGD